MSVSYFLVPGEILPIFTKILDKLVMIQCPFAGRIQWPKKTFLQLQWRNCSLLREENCGRSSILCAEYCTWDIRCKKRLVRQPYQTYISSAIGSKGGTGTGIISKSTSEKYLKGRNVAQEWKEKTWQSCEGRQISMLTKTIPFLVYKRGNLG